MKLESIANFGLQQVDTAGYYLSRYGITDNVNRHNLIAFAMTEKEKWLAEAARLELKVKLRKRRLEQLGTQLDAESEKWIAYASSQIADQLHLAKNRLKSMI